MAKTGVNIFFRKIIVDASPALCEYPTMAKKTPLDRAIEAAGSMNKLAAAIGTSRQNVSIMRKRNGKPSAQYVLRIERATGVPRYELRPDIYPAEEYRP